MYFGQMKFSIVFVLKYCSWTTSWWLAQTMLWLKKKKYKHSHRFQSGPLLAARNSCDLPFLDVSWPGQNVPWGLNSSESKHWREIPLQSWNLSSKREHTGKWELNSFIIQARRIEFEYGSIRNSIFCGQCLKLCFLRATPSPPSEYIPLSIMR